MTVLAMKLATPEDKLRWGENLTPEEVEQVVSERHDMKLQQIEDDHEEEIDEAVCNARDDARHDVFEDLQRRARGVTGEAGRQLREWLDEMRDDIL